MGLYGAFCGVFEGLFFGKIVRRFGEKRVFVTGMSLFVPMFLLFPGVNWVARVLYEGEVGVGVWALVAVLLGMLAIMDLAYGTLSFPYSHLIYNHTWCLLTFILP